VARRIARGVPGLSAACVFAGEMAGAILVLRLFIDQLEARGVVGWAPVFVAVAASVALTAMAMTALGIVLHAIRSRREGRDEQIRRVWSDRWIDVVFGEAEAPAGPLSHPAVASLLDLRESLIGEPAEMVGSLMRDYGIETGLIERLEATHRTNASGRKTVIKPRRSLDRRLELLDELGRARTPRAVPTLMSAASDPEPAARLAGMRALARSVAAIASDSERQAVAAEVVKVLHEARLSMGALAEAMELLGPAAPYVVAPILERPHRYGNRMLIAALDTVGHLRMNELAPDVSRFASSRRIPVRLAALHALTKLERLPAAVAPTIQRAFRDRNPAIRIEAARAAKLLETKTAIYYLEDLLCDEDWTVRRVAATTLASLGGPGIRTLIATSLVHGDHRARSIATQVLVESRSASELEAEPEKVG
jgi:HEAT repeat protein